MENSTSPAWEASIETLPINALSDGFKYHPEAMTHLKNLEGLRADPESGSEITHSVRMNASLLMKSIPVYVDWENLNHQQLSALRRFVSRDVV